MSLNVYKIILTLNDLPSRLQSSPRPWPPGVSRRPRQSWAGSQCSTWSGSWTSHRQWSALSGPQDLVEENISFVSEKITLKVWYQTTFYVLHADHELFMFNMSPY